MFGWEFPPHISGGLGTACYGLTQALGKQNVDVLFVVPKLHGGESVPRVDFVDAGEVPLKREELPEVKQVSTMRYVLEQEKFEHTEVAARITTIAVDSPLSPYRLAHYNAPIEAIESWSYSLESGAHEAVATLETETVLVEKSDTFTHTFSGTYGPDLLLETKRYAEVAEEIAQRFEFDVIHAHDWMTFPAGIAAQRASGKPLIVHVHSTEFDRSGEHIDPQVFRIEQEGMQQANRILAVSQWTKDIVVSRYEIDASKVDILHNGIIRKNPDITVASMPALGSHVVTFLGRLTFQKGPFYFIEAARKVLEKFPNAHFIVAGSGDLFPQVVERVAQLRLSTHFHFTGFLKGDNVSKVWAVSDVYVMPSVSEPFGITPLEAIQAGVPVIVSNQSGVAEVMPHAIKVDFWETEALADAICNVLAYDSLSSTLRKNSQQEISNITWDKAAKKVNTIYHELTH
jgi:glycosyltransferase involved in cell wall biosynthesis